MAARAGRRDRHSDRASARASFSRSTPRPGRLRWIIQTNIANLAGVPSIVYGILGLALFVRAFGIKGLALGPTLLAGVLTLSLLILPIIVITTQEALRAVPSIAAPGRAGAGSDALADGSRPRAAVGRCRAS